MWSPCSAWPPSIVSDPTRHPHHIAHGACAVIIGLREMVSWRCAATPHVPSRQTPPYPADTFATQTTTRIRIRPSLPSITTPITISSSPIGASSADTISGSTLCGNPSSLICIISERSRGLRLFTFSGCSAADQADGVKSNIVTRSASFHICSPRECAWTLQSSSSFGRLARDVAPTDPGPQRNHII